MLEQLHHLIAIVLVFIMAIAIVAGCTSDPGPRQVAEDIINAESDRDPTLDRDCLLSRLDRYTDSELKTIAANLESGSSTEREAAQAKLEEFTESLAACLTTAAATTTIATTTSTTVR